MKRLHISRPAPAMQLQDARAKTSRGDLPGAEQIYRSLAKSHPDDFTVLYEFAALLWRAKKLEEAARLLRKALNQRPDSVVARCLLSDTFRKLGRELEALEQADRAIAVGPRSGEAYYYRGLALAALGRHDGALQAQTRATELEPDRPAFYLAWGELARWTVNDPRLARLEQLAGRASALPFEERVALPFALAKAYADCGDIERSFRCQIDGGAVYRRSLRYDEAAALRGFDALLKTLDASWLQRHEGAGDPSTAPVFIVGMPRSGTTLIEQILASHPKVYGLGERPFFEQAVAEACGQPSLPEALASFVARWSDADLHRLATRYLARASGVAPATAARVVDKTLGNYRFVALIRAALPNARIIHAHRDPVDTCLSIFSILFSGGEQPFSYDLGELGRYYRNYERVLAHWRSILPAGVMLNVRYEDVVNDLEGQARAIIAHCGLEWDDRCVEFYVNDRPVHTASHAQVRQPIYRSSLGRARPPRELLQPLHDALGRMDQAQDEVSRKVSATTRNGPEDDSGPPPPREDAHGP